MAGEGVVEPSGDGDVCEIGDVSESGGWMGIFVVEARLAEWGCYWL